MAVAFTAGASSGARSVPSAEQALPAGTPAPGPVRVILQRACQDCHSRNTSWPWYGNIPPLSWQIHSDVERGRAFMDFSRWDQYTAGQRRGYLTAILAATENHMMPPAKYVWVHREAKLSGQDLDVLKEWVSVELKATVSKSRQYVQEVE